MKFANTAALLAVCGLLSLTGCGQAEESASIAETQPATKPFVPEGAIADDSGEFVYTGQLKEVGDAENGYIKVPVTFVQFQEEGVSGLTQYSDPTGSNVITLDFYEGIPYEDAANSIVYYMAEDENVEGLTGASVTVAGYNAKQIYCHYTDDDKFVVIWLIEDPSNPSDSYYLAIEFFNESADIMACSSTFRTVHDHAGESQR